MSDEQIRSALLEAGWSAEDVERALSDKTGHSSTEGVQSSGMLNSASGLLKDAWQVYKSKFRMFFGVILVPLLSYLPLILIILAFVALRVYANSNPSFQSTASVLSIILGILGLVSVPFLIYVNIWGQAALITAVKDRAENIGVKESFRRSRSKVGSYFWVSLLSSLIVIGGLMLLVVPGIILGVWFSFAVIVLMTEGEKGMSALLKSKEYVRGRWLGVFWRMVFILIVAAIISWVPALPFHLLKLSTVGQLLSSILSFILAPLFIIYAFLLYTNLRGLKGEFTFQPQGKGKFIAIAVVGGLIIPLSILAAIAFKSLDTARTLSRDAKREADINQIKTALSLYHYDHASYPASFPQLSDYLAVPPTDPKTSQPYAYKLIQDGKNYEVCVDYEKRGRICETSQSIQNDSLGSDESVALVNQYQLAFITARKWQSDAALHGYRRIYSAPVSFDDELLIRADSYWFLSANDSIVYEPIVDRSAGEISRIDTNASYEAFKNSFPITFPQRIGPDRALQIAASYPGFNEFERQHDGRIFKYSSLVNASVLLGDIWEVTLTTDLADLPPKETRVIFIDSQSGQIKGTKGF